MILHSPFILAYYVWIPAPHPPYQAPPPPLLFMSLVVVGGRLME